MILITYTAYVLIVGLAGGEITRRLIERHKSESKFRYENDRNNSIVADPMWVCSVPKDGY
jgi:hypothetical protein